MSSARVALLVLLLLPGCFRQVRPAPRRVVEVRWPATAEVEVPILAADEPEPEEPLPEDRPGVRARRLELNGLKLLEVILGDASFDDPLPLVVLLHGRGDRPRVPGGPFGKAPTAMRLVIPRAPTPLGAGFTWLPVSITEGRTALLASSLEERAAELAELIDRLVAERPTVGRPIVAGFSQGAMLTFTLALRHPEQVAVALPAAGWVPPPLMPEAKVESERRVPIRSVHGTADPIVPFEPTRFVVERLRQLSWDAELEGFEDVAHTMTEEMNARFEEWLEEALQAQAPKLGGGLGEPGAEAGDYPPVEPLDPETIEALEEATPVPAEVEAPREPEGGSVPDPAEPDAVPEWDSKISI